MQGRALITLLLLALAALAQPLNARATDLPAELQQIVETAAKKGAFTGSVLVARKGEIIYAGSYGDADRPNHITNAEDTRFLLASVTKQFTATLVLKQVDRGLIRLEAPIKTYLPAAPPAWSTITVHELLNHTSGLEDFLNSSYLGKIRHLDLTPEEIVQRFRTHPLLAKPGKKYSYTNSGFLLLGMILEQVTGRSWDDLLHTEILDPLSMGDSGLEPASDLPMPFALPYQHDSSGWSVPDWMHPSILFALGDIYSNVKDLLLWDQSLVHGTLLSADSRKKMLTPGLGGYGYGVFIEQNFGRREVWHTGHVTGYSNFIGHYIDDDVCIVVLSNLENAPSRTIGEALAAKVFGKQQEMPVFKLEPVTEMSD